MLASTCFSIRIPQQRNHTSAYRPSTAKHALSDEAVDPHGDQGWILKRSF
jgi:hypothetical protein